MQLKHDTDGVEYSALTFIIKRGDGNIHKNANLYI